jgi:hypothetical protein
MLARKQVDKDGAVNVEDAAGFFAHVFGGERFMDYVRSSFMAEPEQPLINNFPLYPDRRNFTHEGNDDHGDNIDD